MIEESMKIPPPIPILVIMFILLQVHSSTFYNFYFQHLPIVGSSKKQSHNENKNSYPHPHPHTSIPLPLLYPHCPHTLTLIHSFPTYPHSYPHLIHLYTYPHIRYSFILFFLFLHFSSFPLSLSRCPLTPFPSLSRTLTSTPYPLALSVPPILSHAPTYYPLPTHQHPPTVPTYIHIGHIVSHYIPLYYIRFRYWTSFSNPF